jgi:hypothetical protein
LLSGALLSFALGNLKSDAKWAWDKLTHATFWQLAALGLGIWMIVVQFQIADARHDRDAWHRQYDTVHAQLEAISSKRNEQKVETQERIKVVTRTIHDADGKAKEVEAQPLPEQCHGVTPSGVLHADV